MSSDMLSRTQSFLGRIAARLRARHSEPSNEQTAHGMIVGRCRNRADLKDAHVTCYVCGLALAMFAGCSRPSGLLESHLSGQWSYLKGRQRWIDADGGVREDSVHADASHPDLVIREDGSFDWSHTMMAMYGDVAQLRRQGDRIEFPERPKAFIEVVKARYEPRQSDVTLRGRDPDMTEDGLYRFRAWLLSADTLRYEVSSSARGQRMELSATLERAAHKGADKGFAPSNLRKEEAGW